MIRKLYHRIRFGQKLSGSVLADVHRCKSESELNSVIQAYRRTSEWNEPELALSLCNKRHALKQALE